MCFCRYLALATAKCDLINTLSSAPCRLPLFRFLLPIFVIHVVTHQVISCPSRWFSYALRTRSGPRPMSYLRCFPHLHILRPGHSIHSCGFCTISRHRHSCSSRIMLKALRFVDLGLVGGLICGCDIMCVCRPTSSSRLDFWSAARLYGHLIVGFDIRVSCYICVLRCTLTVRAAFIIIFVQLAIFVVLVVRDHLCQRQWFSFDARAFLLNGHCAC